MCPFGAEANPAKVPRLLQDLAKDLPVLPLAFLFVGGYVFNR